MIKLKQTQAKQEAVSSSERIQFPPKLLVVGFGFLVSALALSYTLGRSLSTLTLSTEALVGALPVLLLLFLTASLAAIFALLVERKILVLGMLAAAIFFVFPFASLPLSWRLIVVLILFLGFLFLGSQARATHEAYTGFSASHYKGVVRNFFLIFVFILGIVLFSSTTQTLSRQKFEVPLEAIESIVGQMVETIGGILMQQTGGEVSETQLTGILAPFLRQMGLNPEEILKQIKIPTGKASEAQLAPFVEEQLIQLLQQMGFKLKLKGVPKSFAQVTTRVSKALKVELDKMFAPLKVYIPFVVAGMAVLTLLSVSPFVGLVGAPIFFIVYRLLILVRVLKFEEVERKVKRLALA